MIAFLLSKLSTRTNEIKSKEKKNVEQKISKTAKQQNSEIERKKK